MHRHLHLPSRRKTFSCCVKSAIYSKNDIGAGGSPGRVNQAYAAVCLYTPRSAVQASLAVRGVVSGGVVQINETHVHPQLGL